MRRISKNTKAVVTRRPSNHLPQKENSSGPVVRRRNNSIQDSANAQKAIPTVGNDRATDTTNQVRRQRSFQEHDDTLNYTTVEEEERFSGVFVPPTTMIKLPKNSNKKKRRPRTFVMDRQAAKISWDPRNTSKRILIDEIHEIMAGHQNRRHFREAAIAPDEEDRWLIIRYTDSRRRGPEKYLHLIAPTTEALQLWQQSLSFLSRYRETVMATLPFRDRAQLEELWLILMTKRCGVSRVTRQAADLLDIKAFCDEFQLNCSSETILALFSQLDTDHDKQLSFVEFEILIRQLLRRDDIRRIFEAACRDPTVGMTFKDFTSFLHLNQAWSPETIESKAAEIFQSYTTPSGTLDETVQAVTSESSSIMTMDRFDRFLRSKDNSPLLDLPEEYVLDRPMNEYYIASSHNTYLQGWQIFSPGSHAAYVKALLEGCRCIEIDCWPGTKQTRLGRPEVRHRGLTKPIDFTDVIVTINEHAFRSSPYPLIISLEVHCNAKEQEIMAEEIRRVFGEALVTEPLFEGVDELPSPEQLRERIMIKVKPGMLEESTCSTPDSPLSRALSFDVEQSVRSPRMHSGLPSRNTSFRKGYRGHRATTQVDSPNDSGFFEGDDAKDSVPPRSVSEKKGQNSKITRSLGELAVYTKGRKFDGCWDKADMLTFDHIVSVKESRFNDLNSKPSSVTQVEAHNRKYLMRTYPDQGRVKSTNFFPLLHWRRGVQMVAENWQTYDLGQQMNRAMFCGGTDRLGYVLKPQELRDSPTNQNLMIDASTGETIKAVKMVRFSIDVISAQRLTKLSNTNRVISPYVEIEVYHADDPSRDSAMCVGQQETGRKSGVTGLQEPLRVRTAAVRANGLNPNWNQSLQFTLQTKYESLVFLRLTIKNEANDYCHGTLCVKLSSLATGYRYLNLFDESGNPYIFSTLLCRITKEPIVELPLEPQRAERSSGRLLSRSQSKRSLAPVSRVGSSERR